MLADPPVSPAEVAARVIAGLIDVREERAAVLDRLDEIVIVVVEELDPHHERDSAPTYRRDLPSWVRLDAFDRLRKAYEDLRITESYASDVVDDLRSLLVLTPVGSTRRPARVTPARAYQLLDGYAQHRLDYLDRMVNAERRVRPQLAPTTSAGLRRVLREVRDEEDRGRRCMDKLGVLLRWGDGPTTQAM